VITYLRLAFGLACVLAPGWALARACGRRSASAVLAWALAAQFAAWALVFAVHANVRAAVLVLAALTIGALVKSAFPSSDVGKARLARGPWLVGLVLGLLLWHVAGAMVGDGLFHEGRVRKLLDLGDLHLRTVDEFRDGGLHPGYAFPLWHGLLACVAWFSGLDPDTVLRHLPSLLAPLACVVVWEAGAAVFGSRLGGWAVLVGQLAMFCFGPGHGGSWATLAQPGSASRQLLVPAALALFFRGRLVEVALVFGALTLTHPTYAIFLLIPLLPAAWRRRREYAAALVPAALALLWLRPIVDQTVAHDPGAGERARGLRQYASQLVIENEHHFRLAPEVFGRSGSVAVAALVLVPVCALALRRWGAFVLGGFLLVLLLMEVPWLFVHFSDAVSLSQARRAAGFAPFPFAFAGGLALAVRRVWLVPLALVAGIVVQRRWPGDFEAGLTHGGPALATWIALVGGLVALVLVLARRIEAPERFGLGLAGAVCFTLPVFVHGLRHWSPEPARDPQALSPRLVHELRARVPKGSVVIAPLQVSYRVVAAAPLYVAAAPVAHVANTHANDPYRRAKAVLHWMKTGDPSVPARFHATWAIRSGRLYRLPR
jgi:hypothetical protein